MSEKNMPNPEKGLGHGRLGHEGSGNAQPQSQPTEDQIRAIGAAVLDLYENE